MSVYIKGPIELRHGDYRDVLDDVEPADLFGGDS